LLVARKRVAAAVRGKTPVAKLEASGVHASVWWWS
jgi:hypothetical protein